MKKVYLVAAMTVFLFGIVKFAQAGDEVNTPQGRSMRIMAVWTCSYLRSARQSLRLGFLRVRQEAELGLLVLFNGLRQPLPALLWDNTGTLPAQPMPTLVRDGSFMGPISLRRIVQTWTELMFGNLRAGLWL